MILDVALCLTLCDPATDPLLKEGPLRKQRRHIGGWITRFYALDWDNITGMACLMVYHKSDHSDTPTEICLEQ